MSALLKELVVVAVAMLVSAGAVALRDRGVLVPPPEVVVEEFVRKLSLQRWEPARTHLTEDLSRRLGPDSLRGYRDELERRAGRIAQVRGRPFFATDVAAEARVEITNEVGARATLRFPLARDHGLWRISRLDRGAR